MSDQPFWINYDYDRRRADYTESRFAVYVRDRAPRFAETWDEILWEDGTVPFARLAWEVATGPVMSPPYACTHPRIRSAKIIRNEWDGSLGAAVCLVVPQPKPLSYLGVDGPPLVTPDYAVSEFGRPGAMWRDWPGEHSFARDTTLWYEPGGEDVCRGPFLLTSVELDFVMPQAQGRLSRPSESWADRRTLANEAAAAVEILVGELNRIVGPVLAKIEGE